MQPPHQQPMNGQHTPPTPQQQQGSGAPPQQAAGGPPPPPQYYQGPPPPQYYQAPPPAMWGQPQQQAPPPQYQQQAPPHQQQYPPMQQYAPPPQQYAPPPQQYAPPPTQYVAPMSGGPAAGGDEIRSLWIGDLQYWMDENYLFSAFAATGQVASVKIIRNKQTGHSEGYGFIEFHTRAGAEHALMSYNGQMMPSVDQVFRLNWATCSAGDRRGDEGSDHTVFVGDLATDVTDYVLEETFKTRYPSVKGAKVVTDRHTGRSKGYGFVRFGDVDEQTRAMTEMNGMFLSTRQMRIGPAANKKNMGIQQTYSSNAAYQSTQGSDSENDPSNTTIFVGGLDQSVTEDYLRQVFTPYGEIGYVKIPVGKRCGFVQFISRSCAEEAIRVVNGTQIGGQSVRLSWGRSPQNKQPPQQDANQWNGSGYYGYQQGYDGYSYGAPNAQDPNMYAYGTYPGYGNYAQQQQQPPQQQQQPPPPQQQPPQQ